MAIGEIQGYRREYPGIDVLELAGGVEVAISRDGDALIVSLWRGPLGFGAHGLPEPVARAEFCGECGAFGDHPFDCPTFRRASAGGAS